MRIRRLLFVLAVQCLIVAFGNVAKGQESSTSPNWGVKRLVYHMQYVVDEEIVMSSTYRGQHTSASNIYLQDGPTLKPRELSARGRDPAWSSDGKKIAFLGFSEECHDVACPGENLASRQIQVMNADGLASKQLTNISKGVWDFAWSPLEEKIAYCELGANDRTAIVVINADGSGRKELTKMGEVRCAVGMPTLKRTLDTESSIAATDVMGGKVLIKLWGGHESTFIESGMGLLVGVPTLDWSPDGKQITFSGVVSGKPVIGIVDANSGHAKPIIVGYSALWSPDGKHLLFRHDSESTPSVTSICIANADGTQPRKILDNETADFGLTWLPDGNGIAFGSEREHKRQSEIFRINVDGTGLEKIASVSGFSLSSPVFSADGTKLVVDALPPWDFGSQFGSALPQGQVEASRLTSEHWIWLVDLISHRQERLLKGSHASVIWDKK